MKNRGILLAILETYYEKKLWQTLHTVFFVRIDQNQISRKNTSTTNAVAHIWY